MDVDIETLIRKAGGVGKLATALNVSRPTVCGWKKTGFLPGARVVQISRALSVPIEDLSNLIKPPPPFKTMAVE